MNSAAPNGSEAANVFGAHLPGVDELLTVARRKGFRVNVLAAHVGMNVRTFERRFREKLRVTPKAWMMRERINLAAPLLAAGFSNKEVAAFLSYSCESNFCRDFKRNYGCAPQAYAHRGKERVPR